MTTASPTITAVSEPAHNASDVPPSFWQSPFAQNVLPFVSSLVLHISLILLALLTVQVVTQTFQPRTREQVFVPETFDPIDPRPRGKIEHLGTGGDPTRAAATDKFPEIPAELRKGFAEKPGKDLIPKFAGGSSGGDEVGDTAVIGFGATRVGGKGSCTIGIGDGNGSGNGKGDGSGILAPFGVPGGGVPDGGFIKMSNGGAKRIAYVCDASGSMLQMFDSLRFELRSSISRLKAVQRFNVIFFQEQGYAAGNKAELMPAVPDNLRRIYDFLDNVSPRGETNPIPALELAFAQNPELIYLLTDGDFAGPGNDAVVNYCRQKTAGTRIKINTIAFVGKESATQDPQTLEYVKALKAIAHSTGGQFKYVTDEDMSR